MTFDEYRAIEAVNWSTLVSILDSPKHYQHALKTPKTETAAMRFGRAIHTAILEPQRLLLDCAVWQGGRRDGKKWDEFFNANLGKTIITLAEHTDLLAIGVAVREHPVAADHLLVGEAEFPVVWTDPKTEIACKCRVDWFSDKHAALVDLKSTASTDFDSFGKTSANLKYHAKLAFYMRGLQETGRNPKDCLIISVEQSAPYDVVVFQLDEDVLYFGDKLVSMALNQLAMCRQYGVWPGRSDGIEQLRLPAWHMKHEGDE